MSGLTIQFCGAAGQVTGSSHLVSWRGRQVVLDVGLFQGHRQEAAKLNAELLFDPKQLDAVVLSHAHIDHSGRLPLLAARQYDNAIHATPATRDLCSVMLPDSAHIQETDFAWLQRKGRAGPGSQPLYTMADAVRVQELIETHPYRRPFKPADGFTAQFRDAGHILGSANVELTIDTPTPHRLVFSGDIGRWRQPIIRDPEGPKGPIDTLIIESTYALRNHGTGSENEATLGDTVRRVAGRGGLILIPAFAVGRTQEIVYELHDLLRKGQIPEIPIYIDSPLAVEATAVFRMHQEVFDCGEDLLRSDAKVFDYRMVHYIRDVADSKKLNSFKGPGVIISASGMVENGRILHHIANHGSDPKNCILFVGFQASYTLGARIQSGQKDVRVLGEKQHIEAEIVTITGLSAHADRTELRQWVREREGPITRAFCVHGEPDGLEAMKKILEEEGVKEVHVPKQGETFEIG